MAISFSVSWQAIVFICLFLSGCAFAYCLWHWFDSRFEIRPRFENWGLFEDGFKQ